MGMGDRDPKLHGAPRGCFSTEDYTERCELRNKRDVCYCICYCIYCKKRFHYNFKFCSKICKLSNIKEIFIEIFCNEYGNLLFIFESIESTKNNCKDCEKGTRFFDLSPDEKLE